MTTVFYILLALILFGAMLLVFTLALMLFEDTEFGRTITELIADRLEERRK